MVLQLDQVTAFPAGTPAALGETAMDGSSRLTYHNGSRLVVVKDQLIANTFTYSGALATLAGGAQWYLPADCVFLSGDISLVTTSSSGSVIADVNYDGTTIYSTQGNRPTLTSGTAHATFTTPNTTSFAAGHRIGVDVDSIGTGAVTLVVTINLIGV